MAKQPKLTGEQIGIVAVVAIVALSVLAVIIAIAIIRPDSVLRFRGTWDGIEVETRMDAPPQANKRR